MITFARKSCCNKIGSIYKITSRNDRSSFQASKCGDKFVLSDDSVYSFVK